MRGFIKKKHSNLSLKGERANPLWHGTPVPFDHLVGVREKRHRDGHAERSGCLHINDQFDRSGLLNWQV